MILDKEKIHQLKRQMIILTELCLHKPRHNNKSYDKIPAQLVLHFFFG